MRFYKKPAKGILSGDKRLRESAKLQQTPGGFSPGF
jgi:hypothetical protein